MGINLKIKNIKLVNFRSYKSTEIEFHPKLNYIYGKNGSGKTNLIESVYFLANLNSFRTRKRVNLLKSGSGSMYVGGNFCNDDDEKNIKLEAAYHEKKRVYKLNGKTELNLVNYLQSVHTTVFYPDSLRTVKDGPSFRRNFFDRAISATDASYLLESKEYIRLLKERNRILKNDLDHNLLHVWNQRFFEYASKISSKRLVFLKLLKEKIKPLRENLNINKKINIIYSKKYIKTKEEEIFEEIKKEHKTKTTEEKIKKQTCLGPHLDDFIVYFNGKNAKENASQGEQRLLIILVLLAASEVCREFTGENSIYLFDDMSSELDREKRQSVVEYLMSGNSQVFITTTEKPETKNPPQTYSLFDLDSKTGVLR
ncbi:MAG: DNA replication and repair protein RecF [Nitrospinota bacterium]|nr:DNA replication and repair protein RecF [Nitrospinota bacterium]